MQVTYFISSKIVFRTSLFCSRNLFGRDSKFFLLRIIIVCRWENGFRGPILSQITTATITHSVPSKLAECVFKGFRIPSWCDRVLLSRQTRHTTVLLSCFKVVIFRFYSRLKHLFKAQQPQTQLCHDFL